jgi:hypothetical protein
MRHERIKKNGHKHKIKIQVKDKINNKAIVKHNNHNLVNSNKSKIEQFEAGEKEQMKQQYLKNNENDD